MLRCDEFVFVQSSGQIHEMGAFKKVQTLSHVWVCRNCRNFRRNDALLSRFVQQLKQELLHEGQALPRV